VEITYNNIPEVLATLLRKVDAIDAKLAAPPPPSDTRFSVDEVCEYLPGKPRRATIYGKVQRGEIPHGREGKTLFFLKSQIDNWLSGKTSTPASVAQLADAHLSSVRQPRRRVARRA
jgi:hypothetical protein